MTRIKDIITNLSRMVLTRENLMAIVLGVLLIAALACGTMGVQPAFVYQGF